MAEIIGTPKVEATGLFDVAAMAVFKQIEERTLAPYIGNGEVKSGVIKLVLGAMLHNKMGKIGHIAGNAFVFDGVEDLTVALLGGVMGNVGGQAQNRDPMMG